MKNKIKLIFGISLIALIFLTFIITNTEAKDAASGGCTLIKGGSICYNSNDQQTNTFSQDSFGKLLSSEVKNGITLWWVNVNKNMDGNKGKSFSFSGDTIECKLTVDRLVVQSDDSKCQITSATTTTTTGTSTTGTTTTTSAETCNPFNLILDKSVNNNLDCTKLTVQVQGYTINHNFDTNCKTTTPFKGLKKDQQITFLMNMGGYNEYALENSNMKVTCNDLNTKIIKNGQPAANPPVAPVVPAAGTTTTPATTAGTPAKDLPISVWTRIKWDFSKLCLGNDKKLSELNYQKNYLTDDQKCLEALNKYSDAKGMTLKELKAKSKGDLTTMFNKDISGGIPEIFITELAGRRYVDGNKVYGCIDNLQKLKDFLPAEQQGIFTDTQTVGGLNNALIGGTGSSAKPLTAKIADADKQITDFKNSDTYRKTGWNSVERYVSMISCAYGVAGGIILAKDSGSCEAEVPLAGTEHCDECGDAFMPCTAERCSILGNCRAISRDDGKGYLCLPGACEGDSSGIPSINSMDLLWYQGRIVNVGSDLNVNNPYVKTTEVPYLVNTLNLTLRLSNAGKCGYSFDNGTAFESMTYFDNAWQYPIIQSTMIDLSGLALGRTHTIFIKCESTCGSRNEQSDDSNYIRFTLQARPDGLPPEIVRVVPDPQTQYLNNESHYATIEVWLNENGYCKYSTINDTIRIGGNLTTRWNTTAATSDNTEMAPYNNYVHNVVPQGTRCIPNQPCGYTNELGTFSLYKLGTANNCTICYLNISQDRGYEEIDWDAISAQSAAQSQQDQNLRDLLDQRGLTALGLTGKSKLFHYEFRCADTRNNVMPEEETYDYMIFTYPPFNMTIVKPTNLSSYYLPVPLRVETSRETQCRYIACGPNVGGLVRPCNNSWENMIYIEGENYNTAHEKELENLTYGWNNIFVRCRDRGNLEVSNMVRINVLQDVISPMIIRMAHGVNENALFIETNEKADCVVSLDKLKGCNYNFSSGEPLMTTDQFVHSYSWIPSSLHYVKCKDKWNNYPGNRSDANICTAIIDPIEIPEI